MTARFTVTAGTPLAPAAALDRLLDLDRHRAPFTTIDWPRPLVAGSRIVARTQLGPIGFDDVMLVRAREQTHAELEKLGRVVRGRTTIDTSMARGGGSVVSWQQELAVPGVPATVVRLAGQLFYRMLVHRALRGLTGSGTPDRAAAETSGSRPSS